MSLFGKLKLIDTEGKECAAYKGLYKGFSYSVKFQPVHSSWVEPTCCVHCGRNYGLDRNTIRRVLPTSLTMTPVISYLGKDIVFTYVLQPMFAHCISLTKVQVPFDVTTTLKKRNDDIKEHLDLASDCCEKIIDYLNFLDHPERMYA